VEYLLAACIALFAYVVRGFTGFGTALIMTPLLLLVFDLSTVVVASAVVSIVNGVWSVAQSHGSVDRGALVRLLITALPGIALGAWLLVRVDSSLLKRIFGVLVVLFALRLLLALRPSAHLRERVRWRAWVGYLAGGVSGVAGGLFGTAGPPALVYLENQSNTRFVLRATFFAYALVLDGARFVSYSAAGLVVERSLLLTAAMLPASLLGTVVGMRLHARSSEGEFRLVMAVLLLSTGLLLVVG
jgi:hypothetical protein